VKQVNELDGADDSIKSKCCEKVINMRRRKSARNPGLTSVDKKNSPFSLAPGIYESYNITKYIVIYLTYYQSSGIM
jgi:hypothetical protein